MKIITDSAADLTPQEAESLGVTVAPLTIQFPEGEVSSLELTPDEFYDRLRAMSPNIPTTSQPSAGVFKELYQKAAEGGEELLSIHISSGLSGTIESARLGASQLPESRVRLVDTMTLSGGERFQVLATAKAVKKKWGIEKILGLLEHIRSNTEVVFTLETLEYLARGGRIGRVQALAGSLLHIKPVIHVDKKDGKYSSVGRGRTLKQAMDSIAGYIEKTYTAETPLWVTVLHGQFAEQAESLAQNLRGRLQVAKLEVLRISPVLGVHTGPGVVGAAAVPMRLMSELEIDAEP